MLRVPDGLDLARAAPLLCAGITTYSPLCTWGIGPGSRVGVGGALAPLTVAGVAGVASEDAGAASGLVNVAHQLGGSFGLRVLVVAFAAADSGVLDARELLAHRVATSLTAGTVMLAFAPALVLALLVRPSKVAQSGLRETVGR